MARIKKESLQKASDKFLGAVSKLGTQKHLTALRDAFALSIPITIAGAIGIFFITIVFGGWGAFQTSLIGLLAHASGNGVTQVVHGSLLDTSSSWVLLPSATVWKDVQSYGTTIFGWINSATIGLMSIYIALLMSYSMAIIRRHKSPALVSVVGLATFIVLVGAKTDDYGANGMLVAIVGSLAGSEIFIWFTNNGKMVLKLPPSVPPAVGKAFGVLIPAFLTLFFASMINFLVTIPFIIIGKESSNFLGSSTEGKLVSDAFKGIYNPSSLRTFSYIVKTFIQAPFMSLVKNQEGLDISLLMIYMLSVGVLWFFGIHGSNTINGIFTPIMTLLWIDNLSGGHNVFTGNVVNCWGFIGGTGATLPLLILSLIILPKGSPTKEVAKFALPVGIFEVNEPVLFGYPIIFSFKWVIPFIFAPLLGLIWPIIAIKSHWMNPGTIPVPWTTPPIINGLIATQFDWRSLIISTLSILTIFAAYLPFVLWERSNDRKLLNISVKSKSKKNDSQTKKEVK
ncbi:MAG: PTS sugar transporter subunit IIC [Mycoplasmatales bacterium]|nr:PTS sugar transporter subunit IIC [Mycoplasmatales bacterium]